MPKATTKFVRTAPRKIRLILDQIRGVPAETAEAQLRLTPRQGAKDVYATLHAALAAAKEQGIKTNTLVVSLAKCDDGPRLKRRIMSSRGRARPIQKQLSHIYIELTEKNTNTTAKKEDK